ncbi:hypothetical protein T01_11962 [Trichinella spiralis]|uniref:Uncharacterized protein n=1 Tax=Trichinella spiralis TaxID=6334 RepID=A0A0V1B637_TRISP|nr:hypothetical protein T01_11962 [Trichinella spiralis]
MLGIVSVKRIHKWSTFSIRVKNPTIRMIFSEAYINLSLCQRLSLMREVDVSVRSYKARFVKFRSSAKEDS